VYSYIHITHRELIVQKPAELPMLSEYSPKLLEYCKNKGIHCTAYSCLGGNTSSAINAHTNLIDDPIVLKIAEAKSKTPAQIL